MYLKTLELQGFKSFADKTKIELGSGIAAIVGPNGSGKSNVVEAIMWVLGEQSAKSLRGHKMQDVIFNGTKKRKPLGVAEISMILDNSDRALDIDFAEVKVTRRLYRSGEGEYLINGKNVRLKDIHNLFADSGIGSDGYAVIGQGRIAEIIDSRPEERRAIIEETAGVVKYRERKKEAMRKIDRAEDNLLRLTDIMTEIEGRLGTLERDSENAQKYLKFAEEKDRLAIGILAEAVLDSSERFAKLETSVKDAQLKYDEIAAEIMVNEAEAAEQKANIALLEEAVHQREQRFHGMKLDIEKAEGELKKLATQIDGYDDKIGLLQNSASADAERLQGLESLLVSEKAKDANLKSRLDDLRGELQTMESKRKSDSEDLLKAEAEMERLREQAFEQTRTSGLKKNERVAAENRCEAKTHRLAAIAEKYKKYAAEEAVLDVRIAEITAKMDDLMMAEDAVLDEIEKYETEIEAIASQLKKNGEAAVELKMKVNRSEARLKTLEELTIKREGFYPGVRAVLQWKTKAKRDGIFGVIAELMKVDATYSVAIEAVLGSALQNIVTETGEDASDAVAYLKQQKAGIATFLPLDLLHINERKQIPGDVASRKGYRGIAADAVRVPLRAKPAVEYLLGNTLIFETLEDAIAVSRKHKGMFRIVTLEGDVVNAGGSVSGGSREKTGNHFLQRQNEMDELRHFLLTAEATAGKINAEAETLKERKQRSLVKTGNLQEKRKQLREEMAAFDKEVSGIDGRREYFEREREALRLEENQIREEYTEEQRQIAALTADIAQCEKTEGELMREIGEREEAFRLAKSSDNQTRDEYTELQIAFAEAKADYENNRINLNRLQEEYTELMTTGKAHREELTNTVSLKTTAQQTLAATETGLLAKNRELLAYSEDLDSGRGEKDALIAVFNASEAKGKALAKQENEQKDKLYQLSVRRERALLEKEQSEEQLREEYHLILADALPYIDRERTKKDKKDRIKLLKQQIEALGPVNIGAIEEFKAVSERFDFLTGQRDDVLEAKAALENIVKEMDDIIVKRFRATFDRINASFQQTFPAFFRGGYGELQLTDNEDLLTSGVEISVQPPGKRLQHLSLLSGGEKSLSGIALLFAILKVKPSPFYVLDEIDAALDDANVKRFSDYLKEYGNDSQFMVITHRQGTMEAAETMYGVTMAEEGVSKTVSVKLA